MLPSQEALVQRLHHVASYSDQLVVLSGAQGAGKTTLATALATEFDDANVAFMICPMHAENAEIRRKILVQLVSSPIFDDETSLAETILRVAPNQTKPLHIIIDDAHLLSKALWAECIILNQIQCAGQRIAVTLTVPPEFLADLLPQLPDPLRRQILPITLDPLSQAEREALYQTLLRYSDKNPFTPREIVRAQLEKQTGTPQEVVRLLELAINEQAEKKSSWRPSLLALIVGLSSLLIAGVIWFSLVSPSSNDASVAVTYPAIDSPEFIGHGQRLLAPYFQQRSEQLARLKGRQESSQASPEVQVATQVSATVRANTAEPLANTNVAVGDPLAHFHGEEPQVEGDAMPLLGEARSKDESFEAGAKETHRETLPAGVKQDSKATDKATADKSPKTNADKVGNSSSQPKGTFFAVKPSRGYTVQLASVSQLDSLRATLQQIDGVEQIAVAKYKRRWVVLVGNYPNGKTAQDAATKLVKQYKLQSPWVRKWSELQGYELQETFPSREISE